MNSRNAHPSPFTRFLPQVQDTTRENLTRRFCDWGLLPFACRNSFMAPYLCILGSLEPRKHVPAFFFALAVDAFSDVELPSCHFDGRTSPLSPIFSDPDPFSMPSLSKKFFFSRRKLRPPRPSDRPTTDGLVSFFFERSPPFPFVASPRSFPIFSSVCCCLESPTRVQSTGPSPVCANPPPPPSEPHYLSDHVFRGPGLLAKLTPSIVRSRYTSQVPLRFLSLVFLPSSFLGRPFSPSVFSARTTSRLLFYFPRHCHHLALANSFLNYFLSPRRLRRFNRLVLPLLDTFFSSLKEFSMKNFRVSSSPSRI